MSRMFEYEIISLQIKSLFSLDWTCRQNLNDLSFKLKNKHKSLGFYFLLLSLKKNGAYEV